MMHKLIPLILSLNAWAAGTTYKFDACVDPEPLQKKLVAAGFNVDARAGIKCSNAECVITWGAGGETKDPKPIIDANPCQDFALKAQYERKALRVLVDKWKAGTISTAEKDDLLLRFLLLYLGAN